MKVFKNWLGYSLLVVVFFMLIAPMSVAVDKKEFDPSIRDLKQEQFQSELDEMEAEIAANGYTFTVGMNPAMAYKLEDLCTLDHSLPLSTMYMTEAMDKASELLPAQALPSAYTGYFSSIKNQGSCGSCWSFAAVGLVECMNVKATGVDNLNLSEQHLISCNPYGWGCSGGLWPNDYLVSNGCALESCSPYVGTEAPCPTSCAQNYKIRGWAFVTRDYVVPSTDLIKQAIYTYGAVQAGIYADRYFQAYRSGVLNSCAKNARYTNHAIILCGWDDAKGAWLLKNSWGTSWGEKGFMWVKYGCSRVGEGANYFIY